MPTETDRPAPGANQALWTSTVAFTACFAVWTIFSIIGMGIKQELGLSETQFGLLIGTPVVTGSLSRILLGAWSDQFGGRRLFAGVMVAGAAAAFLTSYAHTYPMLLLAALGVGIAGGSFSVGVAYVSKFYPPRQQGLALGIFGAGNVGSAVTKLLAPFVMVAMGWESVARIWAVGLLIMAVAFLLLTKEDPDQLARQREGRRGAPLREQLSVLRNIQVWRFSLYYFFVFGAFMGLVLWLPHYLVDVYGLDVKTAGVLAAFYSIPASLFRVYGGHLSDRYGARAVLYWTFGVSVLCTFMLSYPPTTYTIHAVSGPITFSTSMGLIPFLVTIFVLGFFMSLGKAAVFKHIPAYYPHHVGAVGGLVGMIGGLGGFVLPLAFGVLNDLTGVWTSCFALLFLLVSIAFIWMHVAIRQMERRAARPAELPEFPEMQGMGEPGIVIPARAGAIEDWRPEEPAFWTSTGRPIARRNLWISIYCLLLSFAVWMVWSVVVARLPAIGFDFTTDQLFWLAAVPGLSGATLRIFYAFLVPVFGGRLWTTISTASLLVPAFGIGYAVQDPTTPYLIFLALALLCGLGGGNFASSMANIGWFYPKSEKGNALALNGGLGNLGVSVMQFLVPVVITFGLFGALGGQAQATAEGGRLWMQNAGFVWVPFIMIGTLAAWFGMNDILSARASFADQAAIFRRGHTWLMCWLYTGTFGTFIGMSAGFPLLTKLVFPDVNAQSYVFLGPLVGALSRAGTGWVSDKYGGARVTFWVFAVQILAILGMVWFLDLQSFLGFFAMVLVLFAASGVGNASTFQMVPGIMRHVVDRAAPDQPLAERRRQAERESAAVIGFTSAIAAYGAFYIPKAYGTSIAATGTANLALWGFLIFYATCLGMTWWVYSGPRGLLREDERARARQDTITAATGSAT
ncbi:Nitrate/nitrite transporter [Rubellimicrobium mesophilum DSM 19309]|uniref:Nitrate/nitrite transporter n=1 Tax=Rubellimicrobium mesophilum DSM 19309 TaxID=442562 RepID=A0A017HGF2_9RHOB|nr:MFS transporter [Rubellimicrobium mesophilum]EYD72884.1 Nitrate/nitrite transporter [Rubellimicrobium mesophilum DSM 19309]